MLEHMDMILIIKDCKGQVHKLIMEKDEGGTPSYIVEGDKDLITRRLHLYSEIVTTYGLDLQEDEDDEEYLKLLKENFGIDFNPTESGC